VERVIDYRSGLLMPKNKLDSAVSIIIIIIISGGGLE